MIMNITINMMKIKTKNMMRTITIKFDNNQTHNGDHLNIKMITTITINMKTIINININININPIHPHST